MLVLPLSTTLAASIPASTELPQERPRSEVSVAAVYDHWYDTDFAAHGALRALAEARAKRMQDTWTTDELRFVQVVSFDTSGTSSLNVVVDGTSIPVFAPGPWTPPSRGFLPGGPEPIDLVQVLASHGYGRDTAFSLAVGGDVMRSTNTLALRAPDGMLLGYNDNGGVWAGDGDCNEPLLFVRGDWPSS